MKTRIFTLSLMLMAVVLFSCKKDKEESTSQQEVSFQANQIIPDGGLKSTNAFDVQCSETEPSHAHIVIAGTEYDPSVYRVDGILYTQSIKLDPGTYTVTEFFLYKDLGTPGYDAGDEIVMATPEENSEYAIYTTPDLPHNFTVSAFAKTQVPMQVLCFEPNVYTEFGFDWFQIGEIVLREQNFFGDFCIKHAAEYAGSNYALQPTWGGAQGFIDAPAIFKIDAYKMVGTAWVLLENPIANPELPGNKDFTNNYGPNWGVGAPVKVQYPDNLNISGEQFKFELWILVKVGSSFQYKPFHTWEFSDDQKIPTQSGPEDDGVVDFVLGSCNFSNTDLQLAPYQNLPATCTLTVGNGTLGQYGAYFGVTLSNIAAGYDIANGPYGVFCADQGTNIYIGQTYAMSVFSSLYALPTAWMEPQAIANIDQANWLMNHLGDYPAADWADIQNALWKILDAGATFPHSGVPYRTLANTMAADAAANGNNFVPLPGGFAAVIFAQSNSVQIVFTIVDP